VQEPLEDPLAHEAKVGQVITVLVIFAGGYNAGGPLTWLFLANEFDAGP
jgi:hypothetical protein